MLRDVMKSIALLHGRPLRTAGAVISGLLLAASFPPLGCYGFAWFALVPLILAIRHTSRKDAFQLGLLSGLVFWIPSLAWLSRLAFTGAPIILGFGAWILLATYCALYHAAFATVVSQWLRQDTTENWLRNIAVTIAMPFLWIGLEYVRSGLCTGFPWNTMAISQYMNAPICQVAEFGGVYAVSAVLVLFNAGIAMTILSFRGVPIGARYRAHPELMVALLVTAAALGFGLRSILHFTPPENTIRITAIQPNVEQTKKWSWEWEKEEQIYNTLIRLTEMSIAAGSELVVWPETSMPYSAMRDPVCRAVIKYLMTNDVPLIVGSIDTRPAGPEGQVFNSTMLFEPGAELPRVYDKRHLIPFGEYVPFGRIFPFLEKLAPLGWSCTPGNAQVIFSTRSRPDVPFACLLCFEDTIAPLSREAVQLGARLLINQTNDAWFDKSSGSRQHMAHCVFRCIENRVPALRATNTGITCAIDSRGRIIDQLTDPETGSLMEGFLSLSLSVPRDNMPLTFYTKHGDLLAIPAALFAALSLIIVLYRRPAPPAS